MKFYLNLSLLILFLPFAGIFGEDRARAQYWGLNEVAYSSTLPDDYVDAKTDKFGNIYLVCQNEASFDNFNIRAVKYDRSTAAWENKGVATGSANQYHPSIAVDDSGYCYASYCYYNPDPETSKVMIKRTLKKYDIDCFWKIIGEEGGIKCINSSIATAGGGTASKIFVTYTDTTGEDRIGWIYSPDGGENWSSPKTMNADGNADAVPIVAMYDFHPDTSRVFLSYEDGDSVIMAMTTVGPDTADSPDDGDWTKYTIYKGKNPAIVCNKDTVVTAYEYSTHPYIGYAYSLDGLSTSPVIGTSIETAPLWSSKSPSIFIQGDTVTCAYYSYTLAGGEGDRISFRYSLDLGATWGERETVSDTSCADSSYHTVDIVYSLTNCYAVWTDKRGDTPDIYYSKRAPIGITGPDIGYKSYVLNDTFGRVAYAGEEDDTLVIKIKNLGLEAQNVWVKISSLDPLITIHTDADSSGFGDILLQGEANNSLNPFIIDISPTCTTYHHIQFTLEIGADGYTDIDSFEIMIERKEWTVLFYGALDCNLSSYLNPTIDEMEGAGGTNGGVNLIAELDGHPDYGGYDDLDGNHADVRRYMIVPGNPGNAIIDAYPLEVLGELNTGDTTTLKDFLLWGVTNYPAKHYVVIVFGHGSGYQKGDGSEGDVLSIGEDWTSGEEIEIRNGELSACLRTMKNSIGKNIDVLNFESCLMGMVEVAYEIRAYSDILVASERSMWASGPDWTSLRSIIANPSIRPYALCDTFIYYYHQRYGGQFLGTLSAVDLGPSFTELSLRANKLASELLKAGGIHNPEIWECVEANKDYIDDIWYAKYYEDIYKFASTLIDSNISPSVDLAAESLCSLFVDTCGPIISLVQGDPPTYGLSTSNDTTPYGPSSVYQYHYLSYAKNNLWYYFKKGEAGLPDTVLLTYAKNTFDDGYKDGIPDPGEQIEMYMKLRNSGNDSVGNVEVTLYTDDIYVTIIDNKAYFTSSIQGDASFFLDDPFNFDISGDCPVGHRVTFWADINANGLSADGSSSRYSYTNTTLFNFDVGITSGVKEETEKLPDHLSVYPASPNPFRYGTTIEYAIPEETVVKLKVYDVSGREIRTLVSGLKRPGVYTVTWDGMNSKGEILPSGIYFGRLESPSSYATAKLVKIY